MSWFEERIPGGARWAYVFGSALVFLLVAQFASGIALAFGYSASVPAAWASVARIEGSALGHLLRGLHAQGATLLLAVAGLHLGQTALFGAYRAPRQATWWLGLLLLAMLLAFCLSGSLLPWDERGYWATRVTVGIAGSAPLVGRTLQALATGGSEFGNLTLTRFYAVHATVLPLLLFAFAAAHVAAMRRHGVTPHPRSGASGDGEPFWPRQALYDSAFALLLLGALFFAAARWGAPLQGPADPAGAANPRPEWYFRPLFELLKLMPPSLEAVGAFFLPMLAGAFLFALPFLDRDARRRPAVLAGLAGGFLAAAALCAASYRSDAKSPQFVRAEAQARARAEKALRLAREKGVPPEGALALIESQPEERGARLFARVCTECHTLRGGGGAKAPRLDGFLSRRWIRGVLLHPDSNEYYGAVPISGMEGYQALGEDALEKLTGYLYALRSHAPDDPSLQAGREVFARASCGDCHSLEKGGDEGGPSLFGYGSAQWLTGMLQDAAAPGYYPEQNKMPAFGKRLSPQDIHDLVAFLQTLEADAALAQETP
ncbi:MAG TPA: cytochrome b N-terminal domain-containing protein [Myxococcales bacterium]